MKSPVHSLFIFFTFTLLSCKPLNKEPETKDIYYSENIKIQTQQWDTADINQHYNQAKAIYTQFPDSAKAIFYQTIFASKQHNYHEGLSKSYNGLATIYFNQSNIDSAFFFLKIAIKEAQKANNINLEITPTNNLGAVYAKKFQYDSAAYYFYHVLRLSNHYKDTQYITTYLNLAKLWGMKAADTQYSRRSLKFLKKAEQSALLAKDSSALIDILITQGRILGNMKNYDSALFVSKKVLQLCTDTAQIIYINNQIGKLLILSGRVKEAPPYIETALSLSKSENRSDDMLRAYFNMATMYYGNHDFNKAQFIFENIMPDLRKLNNLFELELVYQYLAIIYENNKQYKAANQMRANYINLIKTRYLNEQTRLMNEADAKYQVSETSKELALAKLKVAQQRTWIIASATALLLLLVILLFLFKRRKHKEEIRQLKASLAGEEKERIRMAQELHDGIVSRLSAIKLNFASLPASPDMGTAEDFQEGLEQLEQSILELRTTSHNLQPGILQQEGLTGAVQIFCEKISKITPVSVTFQMVGTLPRLEADFELGVYRIIQELAQNIIKHSGATHALIQLTAQPNQLCITIDDDGNGFSQKPLQTTNGNGIGLLNLRNRVNHMKGNLSIESSPGKGTSVYLEFDLKKVRL